MRMRFHTLVQVVTVLSGALAGCGSGIIGGIGPMGTTTDAGAGGFDNGVGQPDLGTISSGEDLRTSANDDLGTSVKADLAVAFDGPVVASSCASGSYPICEDFESGSVTGDWFVPSGIRIETGNAA